LCAPKMVCKGFDKLIRVRSRFDSSKALDSA